MRKGIDVHAVAPLGRHRCCRLFLGLLRTRKCTIMPVRGSILGIIGSDTTGIRPLPLINRNDSGCTNSRVIAGMIPMHGISIHRLTPVLHRVVSDTNSNGIIGCSPSGIVVLAKHTSIIRQLARIVRHISRTNGHARRIVPLSGTSTSRVTHILRDLAGGDNRGRPTALGSRVITSRHAGDIVIDNSPTAQSGVHHLVHHLSSRVRHDNGDRIFCLGCDGTRSLISMLGRIDNALATTGRRTRNAINDKHRIISVTTDGRDGTLVIATPRSVVRSLRDIVRRLSVHHTRIRIRTLVIRITRNDGVGFNIR